MGVAHTGSGGRAAARALLSQVHPVFMLPAVATSLFGASLAGEVSLPLAAVHAGTVFLGLYTAHVKDGYVDFHGRGEDEAHPMTAWGCRMTLMGSSLLFFVLTGLLALMVDPIAAALGVPGWLIGYFHAPQLDTNPVTATAGYPLGVGLALLGGFYVQTTLLTPAVVALASVFLLVLSGIKVIDDAQDVAGDIGLGKDTVAVVLGPRRAHRLAFVIMAVGALGVVLSAMTLPGIPASASLAVLPFGFVAAIAGRADPKRATMLLIRGSYLFLAMLLATVWFRPLS